MLIQRLSPIGVRPKARKSSLGSGGLKATGPYTFCHVWLANASKQWGELGRGFGEITPECFFTQVRFALRARFPAVKYILLTGAVETRALPGDVSFCSVFSQPLACALAG